MVEIQNVSSNRGMEEKTTIFNILFGKLSDRILLKNRDNF